MIFEIVSLFDGMSGGQIALTELGHKFKYYASEVDKFAIAQTQLNFPETIQLGNIENWREWNINWSKIDLILAGSPCQGFSFAGKQLNFADERSKLFFVFVDILNHCKKFNPDVKFLLENVNMKKEYQRVINQALGLFPVRINSNLVSAQNRDRIYWSNIKIKMVGLFNEIHTDIEQPKDRDILLRDILESEVDEKYFLSEKRINYCINAKFRQDMPNDINKKSPCLQSERNEVINVSKIGAIKFGRTDEAKQIRKENMQKEFDSTPFTKKEIVGIDYEKMSTLMTGTNKDNLLCIKIPDTFTIDELTNHQGNIITNSNKKKHNSLMTNGVNRLKGIGILTDDYKLRRLTPTECAKLQTVPSWYKWACSDTQIYKMLGNGWTIEVIKHIISQLTLH